MDEMKKNVEALAAKAASAVNSEEAVHFAAAALDVAYAVQILNELKGK